MNGVFILILALILSALARRNLTDEDIALADRDFRLMFITMFPIFQRDDEMEELTGVSTEVPTELEQGTKGEPATSHTEAHMGHVPRNRRAPPPDRAELAEPEWVKAARAAVGTGELVISQERDSKGRFVHEFSLSHSRI